MPVRYGILSIRATFSRRNRCSHRAPTNFRYRAEPNTSMHISLIRRMSALLPREDILWFAWNVRFGPKADIGEKIVGMPRQSVLGMWQFPFLEFPSRIPACSAALCLGPEGRDELRADRNFARRPNGLVDGRWLFDRRTERRSDCPLRRRRDKSCYLLECRPTVLSMHGGQEADEHTAPEFVHLVLISPVAPGYLCHASISSTIRSRTRSQLVAIPNTLQSQLRPAFSACSRTMRSLA